VPTILVEPSTAIREGLREVLRGTSLDAVAAAASFSEISEMELAPECEALLVLDGTDNHLAAIRNAEAFKAAHPGARAVLLVDTVEIDNVLSAYEAGIDGYLAKSMSPDVLSKTLELVMLGQSIYPSSVLGQLRDYASSSKDKQAGGASTASQKNEPWDGVDRRDPKGLSMREIRILRCLMDGDSNKVIARKCNIAEATVKVHVKTILRKIKAKNRTQAALWATEHLPRIERRAGWRKVPVRVP